MNELTTEETQQVVKVCKMRIRQLDHFTQSPQDFVRSMWPVAVSKAELHEHAERMSSAQRKIALYKSIISKLEIN